MTTWVKTAQATKLIGLSRSWLKDQRLNKKLLIEGVHFVYVNAGKRTIVYNVELLLDFIATRANPAQHQQNIEAYLIAQSQQQSKKRGRSSRS